MAGEGRLVLAALATLPALALAGCGGGNADSDSRSATALPQRPGQIETQATGLLFRDPHFSFEMPNGWAQFVIETAGLGAQTAVGVALVGPRSATGSSYSVFVGVYDLSKIPTGAQSPRDIDEYIDVYAAAAGMTVTERPKPATLGEYHGHSAGLGWTEEGSRVEATLVRALRDDLMYLVQCQTDERDSNGINAGCRKIVASFRSQASG